MSSKIMNLKDADKTSKNDGENASIKQGHSQKEQKKETEGFKKLGN